MQFAQYAKRVQAHIEYFYGIAVVTRNISDLFIGDLNGAEIHIDPAVTPEKHLFLLGHLFGHTVQWNTDPRSFEISELCRPPVNEDLLPSIMNYEQEAAAYALDMFHQIDIMDIDAWFSTYTACDQAYLLHYYRTGERANFHSFWPDKAIPIKAKPIPPFTLLKRTFRLPGVVI